MLAICTTVIANSANAQPNFNTLESIANQSNLLDSSHITVGVYPVSISGSVDHVYVANAHSNTISVIDTPTNEVIKTIPVGKNPSDIAGGGRYLYVANSGQCCPPDPDSNTISMIDPTANIVKPTNITVGKGPIQLFPHNGYLYVPNSESDTVSVINKTTDTVVETIPVGDGPRYMTSKSLNRSSDYIYVVSTSHNISVINTTANTNKVIDSIHVPSPSEIHAGKNYVYVISFNDTVSVIDPTTNEVNSTIAVGEVPTYITGSGDDVYVANYGSNTISVINSTTNQVYDNITVGKNPGYISSGGKADSVYVSNYGSNTISVINPANNTVKTTIPVGKGPDYIFDNDELNVIYVANIESGTVSVINRETNKVLAGVTFDINPVSTGQINCNDLDAPTNIYLYVSSGTRCTAKGNKGFEFSSWVENLGNNSTKTINASITSGSPWVSFLDIFGVKSDDPSATLYVNRFGNFTANFKSLPPPLPTAYWASLFTVVATALIGSLLIPAALGWFKSRRQTSRLKFYHQGMASLFEDGKSDEKDTARLNTLNNEISDAYSEGKINNEQYAKLKKDISVLYHEIFNKKLDSLKKSPGDDVGREVLLDEMKKEITDAYSKDKITELHYNLLNEMIVKMISR